MAASENSASVLVLGGTGFIGRNFVYYLVSNNLARKWALKKGFTVSSAVNEYITKMSTVIRVADKVPPQMAWMNPRHQDAFANPVVEFKHSNLINPASVQSAFTDPEGEFDYVVNLAAETKYGQTDPVYEEGIVKLSLNCAREAEKRKVKFYIEVSSGQMCSSEKTPSTEDSKKCQPWTHLAEHKEKVEAELSTLTDLKYAVIRPAIVYGLGDRHGIVPRLIIGAIYKYIKQKMKVILETEEKVFKLENYSPPIGSGYKADVHGRSRSLFLKWLNFQREFQSSDVEEEEEKQQQNSGSLYIDDENDDSKSRNSSIDASWKELTASEEQVLDEEKNEQVHKGIKKKDDENDEESKLIGENVLVNIGNLRPAKPERMVRQVNRRHVEELVSSFLSAKVFTQYTPMVGVVFSEEKEIDFLQNGTCVVEVLGGNHTLQALLEIKSQLDIVTVTIRLYRNLTDQQCLRIGFKHNDVHEKSRKNTFSEQCLLARRLLSDTRRRFRNMGKKNQMTIWREEVATVFGVNKEAIKNTGRVLLHIASLSDQLWDAMTKVFHQWENGRILKQARGEIMKNTFSCITNIANEQEKLELLTQLATGKLEWKLFKKECAKRKAKGKCVKHAAAEPLRAQVEVRNDAYQFPSDEEEEGEVSLAISEASMSSVGTPPKEIQAQQKEDNNNDDLIKSLQEDLETKRKECLQLVKTLNEKDSLIQEMEFTIDSHSKTISTLKNRVSFAESAASRAREELKQMQTDKKQRGQKHNEKVATNLKNVAAKTAKPSEQSAPDDVATNLKNVAAKTAKPSEQSAPDDVDSNATTANKEKGKKRSDNQDSAYGRKKTKLGAVETLNNNEDVIEQKDCALVEYVKGSCYIGVLDDDKLTYCKRPCVKRGGDLAFSKDGLTLNNRDIQKIDQKFVIKKFKGAIVNNTITVNQDDINALKEAFERYMSEADDFTET